MTEIETPIDERTSREMLKEFTASIYQEVRDAKEAGQLIG